MCCICNDKPSGMIARVDRPVVQQLSQGYFESKHDTSFAKPHFEVGLYVPTGRKFGDTVGTSVAPVGAAVTKTVGAVVSVPRGLVVVLATIGARFETRGGENGGAVGNIKMGEGVGVRVGLGELNGLGSAVGAWVDEIGVMRAQPTKR